MALHILHVVRHNNTEVEIVLGAKLESIETNSYSFDTATQVEVGGPINLIFIVCF